MFDWSAVLLRRRYTDLGRRPPLWHPDFPLVLFWSQKSACTAVAHWFFAQIGSPQRVGGDYGRHGYRGVHIHQFENLVFKARPGYLDGCARVLRGGRPAVKFVRDPAARAFSSFLSTCRVAATHREEFWGARVRRQVVTALHGSTAGLATPYSFAEFVTALGQLDMARIDKHVRQQFHPFEAQVQPVVRPIENLQAQLATLEHLHALPALSADPELLASGHHRVKVARCSGATLELLLHEPVAPGAYEAAPPPVVDTAGLADTALGDRVRQLFAADYAAYATHYP